MEISRGYLSQIEAGVHPITMKMAVKVARSFNLKAVKVFNDCQRWQDRRREDARS